MYETLHGGILTTLADSVACLAVFTLTGPEETVVTTDINIRFLAPCNTGVTAKARVIKLGRTMCPVWVEITDEDGTLVGAATVNYMRLGR